MKERGVWAYPWDLEAEPDAIERLIDMGLTYVCVAARYHAVRSVRWEGGVPRVTTKPASGDYADAAARFIERAAGRGLAVDAWMVCFHEDPAPEGERVVNCFGDEYPWASCPHNPAAWKRVADVIENASFFGGFRTVELEAFGGYGWNHGSQHDKTWFDPKGSLAAVLSVCHCPHCVAARGDTRAEYGEMVKALLGEPSEADRERIRRALEAEAGKRTADIGRRLEELRAGAHTDKLRYRLQVLPNSLECGAACPLPRDVWPDEVVVPLWTSDLDEIMEAVARTLEVSPVPVIAGFQAVPPLMRDEGFIAEAVRRVAEMGCHGICAYHDGMMQPSCRKAYARALRAL